MILGKAWVANGLQGRTNLFWFLAQGRLHSKYIKMEYRKER